MIRGKFWYFTCTPQYHAQIKNTNTMQDIEDTTRKKYTSAWNSSTLSPSSRASITVLNKLPNFISKITYFATTIPYRGATSLCFPYYGANHTKAGIWCSYGNHTKTVRKPNLQLLPLTHVSISLTLQVIFVCSHIAKFLGHLDGLRNHT